MSAEHIKILFDEIDVKRTGTLDTDEVRRLLAKLHLPTYLAGRLVQEADTHKSGDISYDEFVVWVHRKEEEVDAVFDEIDVDKSDSLSKKEIDAWLKAHGVRASAADEDKILAMFHASPDGEISYAEFRNVLIFINPTDFALLADDWMHHAAADDLGVAVHTTSGTKAPKGYDAAISGVAGGISAAISRTVVAPLERLRFQMITDGAKYGGSSVACLRGIMAEEGMSGFWRGNAANMVRIIPQNGTMFFAKPAIQEQLKPLTAGLHPAASTLIAGCLAGFVSQTVIYPIDVVRLRITTTPGVYAGLADGMTSMVKAEGTGSLFKGLSYANMWAVPYTAVTFATMDACKAVGSSYGFKMDATFGCAAGAVAGSVSTIAAFPLEFARRRLQAQGVGGRPVLYDGIFACMAGVVKEGGVMALYTGCTANVIKMAPAQAITFGCMGAIKPTLFDVAGKFS